MGVPGLLKALSDIQRPVHISEYRGLRVGLDAYCFLHRGKGAYAEALFLSTSALEALLRPLMEVLFCLRGAGAEPVVVFDGGALPAKLLTEQSRLEARCAARWRAGSTRGASRKMIGGAIDITPYMAAQCMKRLQSMDIKCIVAPCEADAQLAHLALSDQVDVCASSDVDLLAFGCPRVLFGLSSSGCGSEVRLEDLHKCRALLPYRFTPRSLPNLCVLAGCDYLPSLPGVGLKRAALLLQRSGGNLCRALQLARREGVDVPDAYGRQCTEARLVFASQAVFDEARGRIRPLRPLPAARNLDGAGRASLLRCCWLLGLTLYSNEAAKAIAEGNLDPLSLEPFSNSYQNHFQDSGSETDHNNIRNDCREPVITPENLDNVQEAEMPEKQHRATKMHMSQEYFQERRAESRVSGDPTQQIGDAGGPGTRPFRPPRSRQQSQAALLLHQAWEGESKAISDWMTCMGSGLAKEQEEEEREAFATQGKDDTEQMAHQDMDVQKDARVAPLACRLKRRRLLHCPVSPEPPISIPLFSESLAAEEGCRSIRETHAGDAITSEINFGGNLQDVATPFATYIPLFKEDVSQKSKAGRQEVLNTFSYYFPRFKDCVHDVGGNQTF